jgi:hypothetical protein
MALDKPKQVTKGIARPASGPAAPQCMQCAALRNALEESVKLQAWYAELLNQYDDGRRTAFKNADEFLERLKELKQITARGK